MSGVPGARSPARLLAERVVLALSPIVGMLARALLGILEWLGMIGVALLVYASFAGRMSWETPDLSLESAFFAVALVFGLVGWVRLFKRVGTRLRLLLRGHGGA